jgi:nucleoside-diphosphate-sugar epimerase
MVIDVKDQEVLMKNKKVLIFGASGGIGRGMCHVLAKNNEVHAVARFTDPGIKAEIEKTGAVIWQKDLVKDKIDDLPEDFDAIYYEAVLWGKTPTRKAEDDALEVNAYRIGDMLYHFKNVNQIVIGSTSAVYPVSPEVTVEDKSLLLPPPIIYTVTKFCGETLANWVSRTFDIPCSIVRYCWPYAPYKCVGGVSKIEQVSSGQAIEVNQTTPRIMPILYISDAVEKTIKAGEFASVPPQVFNVAGPEFLNEKEITQLAGKVAGVEPVIKETDKRGSAVIPDTTKMVKMLGQSRVSIEEGLRRVYRAYKENITHPEDWMFE